MTVGEKIIFLREQKGWTTNALADLAGVSQSNLLHIEQNGRIPRVDTLMHICDALGIAMGDFFLMEEEGVTDVERLRVLKLLENKSDEYVKALVQFLEKT